MNDCGEWVDYTLCTAAVVVVYLYVWIRRGFCSWCLLRYIWIVSVSVYCHYVIYSASEEAGELTQNYGYYVAIDFIWWHHHHNAEQLSYSSAANIHYCAGRAGGRAYWTSLYLLYTTAAAATANIIILCCAVLTVLGFVSITSSQTTWYITTIGSFRREHSVVGVEWSATAQGGDKTSINYTLSVCSTAPTEYNTHTSQQLQQQQQLMLSWLTSQIIC